MDTTSTITDIADITDITGLTAVDAPTVRWEPCTDPHEAADGTCAGCGWLADDHRLADAA